MSELDVGQPFPRDRAYLVETVTSDFVVQVSCVRWNSPERAAQARRRPFEMDVFAFQTTTPNEVVKPIHPKRMPVLLASEEDFETGLSGTPSEACALVRPFPGSQMQMVHTGEKQDAA